MLFFKISDFIYYFVIDTKQIRIFFFLNFLFMCFKCFGKSVFVSFEDNTTIEKGRFVSLFINNSGNVVVKPFEYEGNLNLFMNPVSVYGVALEDTKVELSINHDTYAHSTVLSSETKRELGNDFN